jgi:hypothetical protein
MVIFTKKQILTLCCLSMMTSALYAQEVDTIQGSFGGMSNQINRDIGDVPGNRYIGDLRFSYEDARSNRLERKFDLAAQVNDESLVQYSLQEAYVNVRFDNFDNVTKNGSQLKIGRQNLKWSPVDALWGLGKLNNRRNFDYFDPGQEGLVGLDYTQKFGSGFFFTVFASGIYIPETNPGLIIDKSDRTITSKSPWGNPPAATTDIEGVDTRIEYIVDYPEIKDVPFRYSAGLAAGVEREHWVTNAYFIRKPENTPSTQVEVALSEDASSVKAFVTPQFYYHDVFGGNVKWRNADVEIYGGGIGIFPQALPDGNVQATTYTELKTAKRREAYLGGGISKINDLYGMGFNYIARVSPYDRDADNLATDPRWNQAVNFFLSRNFKRGFKLMGDLKYDMLTTDRLVMLRVGYQASKALLMTLGVNMIGTPNDGKSYWSPYTNNDALFAGLRYVY